MQIVRTYFLSRVKKLSLQYICRTKPTSYIMLIALLPLLLIICAILLLSYLWERRKCLRMQKRLFRESRKLEHTNHIASAILKNVHAYILLIDNDFKVLKTNYYQLTGTQKVWKKREWATYCNAATHYRRKEAAVLMLTAVPAPYVVPSVRLSNKEEASLIWKLL